MIVNIYTLRKKKGITQRELSSLVVMPQQTISKIEKGQRVPRIDTYVRIINALGYDIKICKKTSKNISKDN